MSLNDLTKKIINDARIEAEEIENNAGIQADKIIEEAKAQLQKEKEKLAREAERMADEKYQNIVTLSRIEAKNKVLERKQSLIDEVFEQARKKLESMDNKTFRNFAMNLLAKFPPDEKTTLVVGKKHKSVITKDFVQQLNSLVKKNAKGSFVLSDREDPSVKDGFYLVTGDVRIDLTLDSIIHAVRGESEMDIIKTLFGKG